MPSGFRVPRVTACGGEPRCGSQPRWRSQRSGEEPSCNVGGAIVQARNEHSRCGTRKSSCSGTPCCAISATSCCRSRTASCPTHGSSAGSRPSHAANRDSEAHRSIARRPSKSGATVTVETVTVDTGNAGARAAGRELPVHRDDDRVGLGTVSTWPTTTRRSSTSSAATAVGWAARSRARRSCCCTRSARRPGRNGSTRSCTSRWVRTTPCSPPRAARRSTPPGTTTCSRIPTSPWRSAPRVVPVTARVVEGEARDLIWQRQKSDYPGFAEYEEKTSPRDPGRRPHAPPLRRSPSPVA